VYSRRRPFHPQRLLQAVLLLPVRLHVCVSCVYDVCMMCV
jgi:hypothetical protein